MGWRRGFCASVCVLLGLRSWPSPHWLLRFLSPHFRRVGGLLYCILDFVLAPRSSQLGLQHVSTHAPTLRARRWCVCVCRGGGGQITSERHSTKSVAITRLLRVKKCHCLHPTTSHMPHNLEPDATTGEAARGSSSSRRRSQMGSSLIGRPLLVLPSCKCTVPNDSGTCST